MRDDRADQEAGVPAPDTKPRKEGSAPSYSSSSTGRKKKKVRASDKENVVFPLGPKLLAPISILTPS